MGVSDSAFESGEELVLLIAEDNTSLGLVVKTKLSRNGYRVEMVETGEEVISRVKRITPTLLLLDYSLPDINGKELMSRVSDQFEPIPFVVMTGAEDQAIAVDMMKMGALDYLVKDQNFLDNLVPAVERALGIIKSGQRLAEAEEALRLSEERFQLAVEGAHDGIWDWEDIERDKLWLSSKVYELLGFEPGDIEPKVSWFQERVHPEDIELGRTAYEAHLESGKPFELELRMRKMEGRYDWFRIRGQTIRDEKGKPKRMAGSFEDISQRKRNEKELQQVNALMREAERITRTGGWRYDVDADRVIWTPELYRQLKLDESYQPVLGERLPVLDEKEDERLQEKIRQALEKGVPFDETMPFTRMDGEPGWGRVTGYPEMMDGEVKYITGAFQDITEQKRTEDERQMLEKQVRHSQKMETIGTLAGGIAHDFNNILAAIYGYVALAERRIGKDHPALEDLEGVMNAAERAKDLVQQILTFSRKSDTKLKPLMIKPIVKESLRLMRASIPSTIRFENDIQVGDVKIHGDPGEIEQVVTNLCTNAQHAVQGRGGVIRNSLKEVEVDAAFARRNRPLSPGKYVLLSVEDNGCGMDQNTLSRIWEPFFTTKNVGEGTGMGLAVVHGIVKNHQGALFVESQLNEGTRVDVYFPLLREENKTETKSESAPPFGQGRILLVDDEEAVTLTTKLTLEDLGYEVRDTLDPNEAFTLFSTDPDAFDLLLTDYAMPGLTGLELALKIHELRPGLPVILMTGFSDQASASELEKHKIQDCLMKPFTTKTLAKAIKEALQSGPNHD